MGTRALRFRKFYPDEAVESAWAIPYEELYGRGVRGLLFDIDNTLTGHGEDATSQVLALMDRLKKIGFRIMFLSNNDEERVSRFNKEIGRGISARRKSLRRKIISARWSAWERSL